MTSADAITLGGPGHVIALVDDRTEDRDMLRRRLVRALQDLDVADEWDVVATSPLPKVSDYAGWIAEEEASVLLLDERLNEEERVPYSGHDIVRSIRPRVFDLPIYYVTAVKDSEVADDAAKVQGIITKDDFNEHAKRWVTEFVVQGKRYDEHTARKLARLSELASLAATDRASEIELEEARALQKELQLPLEGPDETGDTRTRAEILRTLEDKVGQLEATAADLLKSLSNKPQTPE